MATDRTFSDGDVIRIYDRHLTPEERERVLLALGVGVRVLARDRDTLQYLRDEGRRVAWSCGIVLDVFANVFDGIADAIPEEYETYAAWLADSASKAVLLVDPVIAATNTALRVLPAGTTENLASYRDSLVEFRRQARLLAQLARNITDLEANADDLRELGDQATELGERIDRLSLARIE